MTTSYPLLGLLREGPGYGYDLKKAYDILFGNQKPLAFGQVYATLARMKRDELVVIVDQPKASGGPERKQYAITARGEQELHEWLGTPEPVRADMQAELFVKVATAVLVDASPDVLLDKQRLAHLQRMRELTRQRREADLAQMLRIDYSLFHLEADLRWIDITAARINELRKEIKREK